MDISDVPMAHGFVDVTAIIDWFGRRVLFWRLSITIEADFCIEALEAVMVRHGRSETVNTDQGSQFTSFSFNSILAKAGIAIGEGAWRDDIFVERL